jgi:hypothetical protein
MISGHQGWLRAGLEEFNRIGAEVTKDRLENDGLFEENFLREKQQEEKWFDAGRRYRLCGVSRPV